MSDAELKNVGSAISAELQRRQDVKLGETQLQSAATEFIETAKNLAVLKGSSANEVMEPFLPSEFIDWLILGGATSHKVVGEWVQPSSTRGLYNTGDSVIFNGKTYVSQIDGNMYSPGAYPQAWRIKK